MLPHLEDTIVALASAPGAGARAIVRVSGPRAFGVAEQVVNVSLPRERRWLAAQANLPNAFSPLPVDVYVWPAPRTYTGQDIVELHTLGCPPLVDLVVTQC